MNSRSPGYTLVEILIVVFITALVMGAVYETLAVQQRSYRKQTSIVASRQTSRTTLDLLTAELREVSATSGDLLAAAPESVTFRSFQKIGVVNDIGASTLDVWRLGRPFEEGDSIVVYTNTGDPSTTTDDQWAIGRLAQGQQPVTGVPCAQAWDPYPCDRLPVEGIPINVVDLGAPVRAFRPVTYGIYQVDGRWVLGRHGAGEPVVALVGPLAEPGAGGFRLRYFTAAGTELQPPLSAAMRAQVDRIDIQVRGWGPVNAPAGQQEYVDSLTAQVRLRGNAWN